MSPQDIAAGLSAEERELLAGFQYTNIVSRGRMLSLFDLQRKGLVALYTGSANLHPRAELTDLGRAVAEALTEVKS